MQYKLYLKDIQNYNVKFINELKYQVKNNSRKYALETAKAFESIFIHILLKSMRKSLNNDSLLDNNQSHLYTEVYDEQISQELSKKGFGLSNIILQQIDQNNKIYK
ncbi:Peptidoglycan hydrolase FlgJ [Buchnera aphidicola (Protaphis terricola)]|uniref:rod-binding protein n=1 Tax=Buchnera aphidicola TaxID=9 RepID=UPI0034641359